MPPSKFFHLRIRPILSRMHRGFPGQFWWLWAGAVINALATFVFPFLALFLTARGLTLGRVGVVVAMFSAGAIVSGPISGLLTDRFGRRPTLLISIAASAAMTAILGSVRSVPSIVACTIALGLVANAFRPALNTVVADLISPGERRRAFGLIYWGVNTALIVSYIGGGLLAVRGYDVLFLVDAATTAVFGFLIWLKVSETHPAMNAGLEESQQIRGGYLAALADRHFMAFVAVNSLFILVFWQLQVAAPIDMARHGLGPDRFGRVYAVNGLLIATLQPFAFRFTRRFDSGRILAVAALLVGVGYGAYRFCTTAAHYAAAVAIWTIGEILALPVASALVADLSPVHLRGRYQGVYSFSFAIGTFAASLIGSVVMERFGASALWTACFGISVLAAGSHLVIGHRRLSWAKARKLQTAGTTL